MKTSILKYLVLVGFGASLLACGASQRPLSQGSGERDLGSREDPRNPGASAGELAECNRQSFRDFDVILTTHYQNFSFVEDKIDMIVKSLPSAVTTTNNHYLSLCAWHGDNPAGPTYKMIENGDQQICAVHMNLIYKGGITLNSTPLTRVSQSTLQGIIDSFNQQQELLPLDLNNFFDNVKIELIGLDFAWDAVSIVLVEEQNDENQAVEWMDMLLPAFSAHPRTYQLGHPNSYLYGIHPFISSINSSTSESEFKQASEEFCQAAIIN